MDEQEILYWVNQFNDAGDDEKTNEKVFKKFTAKYGIGLSPMFREVKNRLMKNKQGITFHEAKQLARNYHFFIVTVAIDKSSEKADKTFEMYSDMIKRIFGDDNAIFLEKQPSTKLNKKEIEFLKKLTPYQDYEKDYEQARKKAIDLANLGTPFDKEIAELKNAQP